MKILLLEREGTDLYTTLYDSETSRAMLRFYHPVRHPAGVEITTASLGSALSLASELRWYIQRYVDEVLFTGDGTVFLTWSLAGAVYERGIVLSEPWPHRLRYRIHGGKVYRSPWDLAAFGDTPGQEGASPAGPPTAGGGDRILEVWTTAGEYDEEGRGEPLGHLEPLESLDPTGPPGPAGPATPGEPDAPGGDTGAGSPGEGGNTPS